MLTDLIKFKPGTQKSPQQTSLTMPCFDETDHVHFPDGDLTTLAPYSVASITDSVVELLGGLRFIHTQKITGTYAGTYGLHGSNTRLYASKNNALFNITPFADQKAESLGSDPFSAVNGDATLVVTWEGHGLSVGDAVEFSGAVTFAGVDASTHVNIEHTVSAVSDANTFEVELGTSAGMTTSGGGSEVIASSIGVADTLGANPVATTLDSRAVTMTLAAHGLAVGDRVKLRDVTATGGLPESEFNTELIVQTVPTADTFTFTAAVAASSTAAGGGSTVRMYRTIAPGNLDQATAEGYGVGDYGEGLYGVGGEGDAQNFPRIWSGDRFGNSVVLNPGDYIAGDGQKIYFWDGNVNRAPTVLANAPTDVNGVRVVNNGIVALRGTKVQIGELGNGTVWSGVTTFLSRDLSVWKLISCHLFTEKIALIFSPNKVYLLAYTGTTDIWDLVELFNEDGIIAPRAACLNNSVLYWRGARRSYQYDGSLPQIVENDQNEDWINQNINNAQVWKSFAYPDAQNNQWFFHFPTGTENEPSDYFIHNTRDGSHTLGKMRRTAAQQTPMLDSTFYVANSSSETVAGVIYRHFTTGVVTFDWFAQTSYTYFKKGNARGTIKQFIPDDNTEGDANLRVLTREYPKKAVRQTIEYVINATTSFITPKNATGRLFSLRFSGNRAFTIGAWLLDVVHRGSR